MTKALPLNSMASVQSTPRPGAAGRPVPQAPPATPGWAPFGSALLLTMSLAIGAFGVLAPLALLLMPATELPPPFPSQQQDAETLLFLVAFALILPAALLAGSRIAARISARFGLTALSGLAMLLAAALLAALLAVKVSERLPGAGGRETLLVGALLWCGGSGLLLWAAATERAEGIVERAGRARGLLRGVLALLGALAVLAFTDLSSVSLPASAIAALLGAGILLAAERLELPRPGRAPGLLVDLLVAGLLLLAVPNLVVFGEPGSGLETTIIQFHQDFFLGPANQVLAGDAMLVDTLSQYGVGSIYFLAGIFTAVPIGNGTLGLIEGILSAGMFIAAYGVLRMAGAGRLLAAGTLAVAVVALVYGLEYPLGGLLQHGAIRFGLPVLVIVAAVAEARWERRARGLRIAGLAVVGLSSIWALEAFGYTLATAAALLALGAWATPGGERRGLLLRRAGELALACLLAHALLAAATLAASGQLPHWGRYLATLKDFLFGELGDLTYDFSPWSPGLAVGAVYLASAAAIVLLLRRRPELSRAQWPALVAATGTTAWGIGLFSYLVNRSADHIIPYVCLPAVMLGALWLSLLRREGSGASAGARRAGLAAALALAALLLAVAWSSVDQRFSQSALAHAAPGGSSFRGAVRRLWSPPPINPAAGEGERLLERYMPGQQRSVVLTEADLSVEVLMRSQRGNALPFGDPWEDSLVPQEHLGRLEDAVDRLRPGQRVLLDESALAAFAGLRRDSGRDPLAPSDEPSIVPTGLAGLQQLVLNDIGERFRLRSVARGSDGLEVAELVPR